MKTWVLYSPEPPEFKKTFLIQLAWAHQLDADELNTLLSAYENQVRMQILLQQEKQRRGTFSPDRTEREAFLWDMIYDNVLLSYENEWNWLQKIRNELFSNSGKGVKNMNYNIFVKNDQKYIECISAHNPVSTEQDALDLIAVCGENDTNLLMIHAGVLSEDFFKLEQA